MSPSLRQTVQTCSKIFYVAASSLWKTLWRTWKTTHHSPLLLLNSPQLPTRGKIIVPFYPAKSKGEPGKTARQSDFSHFVQSQPPAGQRFASKAHGGRIFAGKRKIAASYQTMQRYILKFYNFLEKCVVHNTGFFYFCPCPRFGRAALRRFMRVFLMSATLRASTSSEFFRMPSQ